MSDSCQIEIINLATQRFGTISHNEATFLKACTSGNYIDFSSNRLDIDNPANAVNWGDERTLSADKIGWVLTDPRVKSFLSHKGIRLLGCKIQGLLDLSDIDIEQPLLFYGCCFLSEINFLGSRVRKLSFINTYVDTIIADNIRVEESLFFCSGSRSASGEINGHGNQQEILENYRFHSTGIISIKDSTIGGNLFCDGGHFNDSKEKETINAEGARIKGSVFMRYGFQANQSVNLIGVDIQGDLDCRGGHFETSLEEKYALYLESLNVQGTIFLSEGFEARGGVWLLGSKIGRTLCCNHAKFLCNTTKILDPSQEKYALLADSIQVARDVYLSPGFDGVGKVSFDSATIKNCLRMDSIILPAKMDLNLSFSQIHIIRDAENSWPTEGHLHLFGLVYDKFNQEVLSEEDEKYATPIDGKSRLRWLRLQPTKPFSSQSYSQLAEVLKSIGSASDATEVLIEQKRDSRKYGQLNCIERLWDRIFDLTIGYGHRPLRTLAFICGLWVFGSCMFFYGYSQGLITPSKNDYNVKTFLKKSYSNANYPRFNALAFSLDTLIPLVDLHQQKYWLPNANKKGTFMDGKCLRYYFWIHIILGWALTSLSVAGLTGLIRRT